MANDDPRVAILVELKVAFDGDPQAIINQTEPIVAGDLAMMGRLIQLYCAADFNGRRNVDVLRHAALGEPRSASRLQDSQMFPMLGRLATEHLGLGNLCEGLLKAGSTIEMRRVRRHNLVHLMARRVRGENAIVTFTMNAREAERRRGRAGLRSGEVRHRSHRRL